MITNYDDLPIGKYLQILDIMKTADDPNDVSMRILSVLSGMSEDELADLPIAEFSRMMGQAAFVLEPPKSKAAMARYNLDGMKLDVDVNITKMTTAQYIDFQTYCKDPDKYYVEILSCFMIPHGKKYNKDYDIAEVQQTIREFLPTNCANGIYAFFLRKSLKSMQNTLSYSEKILTKLEPANSKMKNLQTEAIAKIRKTLLLLKNGGGYAA